MESNLPPMYRLEVFQIPNPLTTIAMIFVEAKVEHMPDTPIGVGQSVCGPKDKPSFQQGRAIAVGRAIRDYKNREARALEAAILQENKRVRKELKAMRKQKVAEIMDSLPGAN